MAAWKQQRMEASSAAGEGGCSAAADDKGPPLFEVVPVEGRGLGVVATRAIERDTFVFAEAPLLCFPGSEPAWADVARSQFDALPAVAQQEVMSLQDAFGHSDNGGKTLEGILRTNGLSRGMSTDGVLCKTISRFNHSCNPNCDWCWDETANEVRVYSAADIAAGDELCIYYTEVRASRVQRRRNLSEQYRFECNCVACALHGDESEASDRRRTAMKRLLEEIEAVKARDAERGVRMVCELLDLYDQEGIGLRSYRKSACYFAFQFSLSLRDEPGIKWWVQRAYEHSIACHGPRHQQTIKLKSYVKDPHSHPASGRQDGWAAICTLLSGIVAFYVTCRWTLDMLPEPWQEAMLGLR